MFKSSSNNKGPANSAGKPVPPALLWMLRVSLSLLLLLFYKMSMAQTKGDAKIYGYTQSVSGGAAPDRSLEPGSVSGSAGTNYFIYLQSGKATRIYPSELWLDGNLYGVQVKAIAKTPVTLESPDPALHKKVLVPQTTQRVVRLVPISANGVKKSAKGESLSKTNAVVAVYKQGGKFYYVVLSELNSLSSAALQ